MPLDGSTYSISDFSCVFFWYFSLLFERKVKRASVHVLHTDVNFAIAETEQAKCFFFTHKYSGVPI